MTRQQAAFLKRGALALLLLAAGGVAYAAGFPTGTFTATLGDEKWAMKFDGKGKVIVTHGGQLAVEASYKVKKDEVVFTDEKGPFAGKGEKQTGRYRWKLEGKNLTFTKIEDKSEGREGGLTAGPWVKEE